MTDDRLEAGQILDVRQAAEMLGYHEETLRRMTREGRVPAFRIGRKWHYDRKVLGRWTAEQHLVQKQRQEASEAPTVLVVDDEADICSLYARVLTGAGFTVEVAADGQEALQKMEHTLPSLLVLDLAMPELDGVGVLKYVRERDAQVPVIVSTGHPDGSMMARALVYGAFTLLAKPVSPRDLVGTATMLVAGRAATQTQSNNDPVADNKT